MKHNSVDQEQERLQDETVDFSEVGAICRKASEEKWYTHNCLGQTLIKRLEDEGYQVVKVDGRPKITQDN